MNNKLIFLSVMLALFALSSSVTEANHAWGRYHWNISTAQSLVSPLKLGDNLNTSIWKSGLSIASFDWNKSVLKNAVVGGTSNSNCDPTLGRVEVCNSSYGSNGWLGIAQVWAYRGRDSHIAQAVVKLNDTYFDNIPFYNTLAWRDYVVCQEVGHTFGLDHQNEDFSNPNVGSCMDYTNDPDGSASNDISNLHPNLHDYEMLEIIYSHLNSTGGNAGGGGKPKKRRNPSDISSNDPSDWGRPIKQDSRGRNSLYEREAGNNLVVVTHVTWADEDIVGKSADESKRQPRNSNGRLRQER